MKKQQDHATTLLRELVIDSNRSREELQKRSSQAERILRLAETARKLETEHEKVVPFYEETAIPDDPQIAENIALARDIEYEESWNDVPISRKGTLLNSRMNALLSTSIRLLARFTHPFIC